MGGLAAMHAAHGTHGRRVAGVHLNPITPLACRGAATAEVAGSSDDEVEDEGQVGYRIDPRKQRQRVSEPQADSLPWVFWFLAVSR